MRYVDLDTMKIVSRDQVLTKGCGAKAANDPLSDYDLIAGNAAELDESVTGEVGLGSVVLNADTGTYQREYRELTTVELVNQERHWRDSQFPLADIAINRVQANHSSKVGLVSQWYDYQNALRDYPQGAGFPDRTLNPRPVEPE